MDIQKAVGVESEAMALRKVIAALLLRVGGEVEIGMDELPASSGTLHIWIDQRTGNLKVAYTK